MPKLYNKNKDIVPSTARYIGRPGSFGNPFIIGADGTRDEVCDKFEAYVLDNPNLLKRIKQELRGCDLFCYCTPLRCHGETILRIANE